MAQERRSEAGAEFFNTIEWIAAALVFVLAARVAGWIVAQQPSSDTLAFWTAGRMWSEGLDPYGAGYQPFARHEGITEALLPAFWLYPPQWWFVCRPLAELSVDQARLAWSIGCALTTGGAIALALAAARSLPHPPTRLTILGFITLVLLSTQLLANIYVGQTGTLVFFGFGMLFYGAMRRRDWIAGLGLAVLLMKPQLGLVVAAVALLQPALRRPALMAGALTALSGLPLLWQQGLTGTLGSAHSLVTSLGRYQENVFNLPAHTTGLNHAATMLVGTPLPSALLLAIALALTLWLLSGCPEEERWKSAEAWTILFVTPTAILSLHQYDLMPALLPSLLMAGKPTRERATVLLGAGMVALCMPTGETLFPGTAEMQAYASAATLGLALLIVPLLIRRLQAPLLSAIYSRTAVTR